MSARLRSPRRRLRANAYGAHRINQRAREALPTPFDNTPLEIDKVRAVAEYTALYAIADLIPDRASNSPGRPAHYPVWVTVVHKALHGVFGSANMASRIMANLEYWELICKEAARHGKTARAKPPRRHHHVYAQPRLDTHIDKLGDGLRDWAAVLALKVGCLNPDKPVSRTNPSRGQFVAADGTVLASPERQSTTEKKKANGRKTVHAELEVERGEGSKLWAYGSKFVFMCTRPDATRNLRIILDAMPVPPRKGYKGEAGVTLRMIDRLKARGDLRVDGICYDGAFRGVHIDYVMKRGMIALVPTHAGTAVPTPLGPIKCQCGDSHELWTDKGRLHERTILDTGEAHLHPLPITRVYDRRTPKGTYRWYIEYAPLCGTVRSERIDNTERDIKKGYNRAEHLRQFTKTEEGGSLYDRCYGWREDSESLNNTLDRTLYGGRITAHSAIRQHSVMIGFALGRNAIAAFIHQKQERLAAS